MATGEGGGVLLGLCRREDLREKNGITPLIPQKRLLGFFIFTV